MADPLLILQPFCPKGFDDIQMLAGVSASLQEQLDRTGTIDLIGEEYLFAEQARLGAAMNEALAAARILLNSDALNDVE